MRSPRFFRHAWLIPASLFAAGFGWHFRQVFFLLASDDFWVQWLKCKDTAGSILGSLIGGLLTITAGISTVVIYNSQSRSENLRQFLAWLADFNTAFHSDCGYSAIRLRLAKERSWIRKQLVMELLADGDLRKEELPAADRDLFGRTQLRTRRIQWRFLKQFTDYLYFFEQILAFGEILARRGSRSLAPTLVNHFGWFLRSLCCCWWEEEWPVAERNLAEGVFAIYLAANRYRRLAQVSLLLRRWNDAQSQDFDTALFRRVSAILQRQTPDLHTASDYRELSKQWELVIGAKGFVASRSPEPVAQLQ